MLKKLKYFLKYELPFSKGWNSYNNCLYHWWKVKEYVKRPTCHFRIGRPTWFFGLYCRTDYYNPIINIRFSAVGWKSKWDEPRHEWDPFIEVMLFRHIQLLWIWNWVDDKDSDSYTRSMATWEVILWHLYFDKSLKDAEELCHWKSGIEKDAHTIRALDNFTEKGKVLFNDSNC